MADIKVRIHTNTDRKVVITDSAKTPKQVLVDEGVDFADAMVHMDGAALDPKGMNSSFDTHGVTAEAVLAVVVKTISK